MPGRFRHVAASVLCVAAARAGASELSLKAVEKNGVPIGPTSHITAKPGDQIVTEVFLSGWAADLPSGIRLFEVRLDSETSFTSGGRGTILPCHWDAPLQGSIVCSSKAECPSLYPVCSQQYASCVGPNHDPEQCAFIDETRPDYPFFGLSTIVGVATSTLNYRYFALAQDVEVVDSGSAAYCATLILDISTDACGMFVIQLQSGACFIANNDSPPSRVDPGLQPLTILLPPCPPKGIGCQPEHCAIDARIPHDPRFPGVRLNSNIVVMNFTSSPESMTAEDFEVTVDPSDVVVPGISQVTPFGDSATVVLNQRIRPTHYTCVRHIESNWQCCLGSLPADADWSGLSNADDLDELSHNLAGAFDPVLQAERCDTDRSGLCAPADLLMAVDLLVGVDAFTEVDGDSLPPCPPNEP